MLMSLNKIIPRYVEKLQGSRFRRAARKYSFKAPLTTPELQMVVF